MLTGMNIENNNSTLVHADCLLLINPFPHIDTF